MYSGSPFRKVMSAVFYHFLFGLHSPIKMVEYNETVRILFQIHLLLFQLRCIVKRMENKEKEKKMK